MSVCTHSPSPFAFRYLTYARISAMAIEICMHIIFLILLDRSNQILLEERKKNSLNTSLYYKFAGYAMSHACENVYSFVMQTAFQ